ncbi:LysR family transcriptional regulator [Paenibacillus glycanilyticus]|uniref:LysR family transcriptional regulator n=1 Tax=Paenibacillus glycanilyticus TaxID=126569 RepID=A0ABQ6GGU7_9BACL|nr:LysR family transcriptional regulator [Paenibacillus glycanilyticus]GLX69912.1 LysR family transcriptional regulator [Paenibacillus glycanilyticus]
MNIEQLEYVKEVVETSSMSLAAQNLHVSQSAISQSISLLEKEIGIPLFKRSRHGTVPTEDGKNVIGKMLEILKKVDEIKDEVQSITSVYKGELVIATIPSLSMTFLPKALARFKKDFPQIKVMIIELESRIVIDKVAHDKAHLGLVALNHYTNDGLLESIAFHSFQYKGELQVIVPRDSALALHKELMLKDLADNAFIMSASGFWDGVTEDIRQACGDVNVIFTTTNPEVIKRSVAEGLGISLMSSLMLRDDPYVESGRIVSIPLAGYRMDASGTFGGIYSKKSSQHRLARKFLEYIEV